MLVVILEIGTIDGVCRGSNEPPGSLKGNELVS